MSSTSDPLDTLDPVPPSKENLKAITEGAKEGLLIIVPWHSAKADTPDMQKVITSIVGHCIEYVKAIDKSIRTAEDGYIISKEAIDLCKLLLAPEKTDREELQGFIEDMKARARKAVENCKATMEMFKAVNTGLLEMSKEVPKAALGIKEGEKNFLVRIFHTFSSSKSMDVEAAMKKLNLAAVEVAKLSDNVNEFVKWWSDMETNLKAACEKASELVPDKSKQYRVRQIKERWTEIMNDYASYKAEIVQLQSFYPPGITLS